MTKRRLVAVVPAWNEEGAIGQVVDEIRAFDPAATVVVVDDASSDETARVAEAHGATVLRLLFNVGIGGAVQTGFRYARDEGFEVAVRLDGDGQHDASELEEAPRPDPAGTANLVIGSRFVDPGRELPASVRPADGHPRVRALVSLLGGQKVTDTTSGFIALDRAGIELFAVEYPHDYPEVEATLVALGAAFGSRRCRSRCASARRAARRSRSSGRSTTSSRSCSRCSSQACAAIRARGRAPMTPIRASIAGAIASLILILVVVELVRGRRLKERYALLWLATGVVLLVLSVWREGLNTLAGWLGVTGYPPACSSRSRRSSSSSCSSTTRR